MVTYTDFVNNYLIKDGMVGNATNLNKAPNQLKLEVIDLNTAVSGANLTRGDIFLSSQSPVNMFYDASGNLIKIRYITDTDTNYQILSYTSGSLSSVKHYVNSVLVGTTTLTYSSGNLVSATYA